MSTLAEQVADRIGAVTETDLMVDSLNEALANLVQALPVDKARQYGTEKSALASAGVAVRGRVLDVRVGDRVPKIVPASRQKDVVAGSSGSIYKASELFPAAWQRDGKWFGYPTNQTIFVIALEAPTVAASDSTIPGLPQGAEELAVLYACSHIMSNRFYIKTLASLAALPSVPTAPTAPSFSYTDAVAGVIGSVNIGTLPALTAYNKPTHSAPTEPTISPLSLPTAPDPATVVGTPSFTYSDAVAGTVSAPTIGALPTAPTYSGPTDLSGLIDSIIEGDIGVAADQLDPTKWFSVLAKLIENEEDPELAQQAVQRINQFISASQTEIQNAIAEFNDGLEEYKAEIEKLVSQARMDLEAVSQQAQLDTNVAIQNELQTLAEQVQEYEAKLQYLSQQVNTYQNEVNANVAEWQANELQSKIEYYFRQYAQSLEVYAADQQNELNVFQSNLQDFQADVQKEFRQAEVTLQRLSREAELTTNANIQNEAQSLTQQVQEYRSQLGRYQSELQGYSQQVQSVLSEFEADFQNYQAEQQRDQAMADRFYQQYQQKLQLMTLTNDGAAAN